MFILLGAAVNVAVAVALAFLVDVSGGQTQSAEAWTGRDEWTVTRWSRAGAAYILSVREASREWSPGQATGIPDAPAGGDSVNAWASATADGDAEWLLLEFPERVVPAAVRVYETCSTGALCKVGAFTAGDKEVEAWSGADPTPGGERLGRSEVKPRVHFPTDKIKLYFDSPRFGGWNEVDAVALVTEDGREVWAQAAEASSTYANRFAPAGATAPGGDAGPSVLAPAWTGLQTPAVPRGAGVKSQQRAVEARGWPMLALWGNAGSLDTPAPTVGSGGAAAGGAPPTALSAGGPAVVYTNGFLLSGGGRSATPGVLGPVSGQAVLPFRPVWGGFLANTAFYAVVLRLLHWSLTVPRRFVLEVSRLRRGCCIACGYDLGYDFAPGCPECGWRRDGAGARGTAPRNGNSTS